MISSEHDANNKFYSNSFNEFANEHEQLWLKYRVAIKITKRNIGKYPNTKLGDIHYTQPEIPNNPKDAFLLLDKYYAAVQCSLQKHLFRVKYKTINEASLLAEKEVLEKWINDARQEDYALACDRRQNNNPKALYLRLVNRYYDNHLMDTYDLNERSLLAQTYGQYVLFYNFIMSELANLQKKPPKIETLIDAYPEIKEFLTEPILEWYEKSYEARISVFGDTTVKDHCEQELVAQKHYLEQDLQKSVDHKNFNIRLISQACVKRRKEIIEFLEQKIEEDTFPEIPFISKLTNSNFNISSSIIDAYYRIVPQPGEHDQVPEYYVGEKHRINPPYYQIVYGAYVLTTDWEALERKIEAQLPPFDKISKKEVEEALLKFAYGFKKGYYTFDTEILGGLPLVSIYNNNHLARRIFDFLTATYPPRGGYPISYGTDVHPLSHWFDSGIEAGKYYRAWYVVLEHYTIFEQFFNPVEPIKEQALENNEYGFHFSDSIIEKLSAILKPFCSEASHQALYNILKNPTQQTSRKIHFLINGNQIADMFKQLHEAHLIVNCSKKDLESWIEKNFTYSYRNKIKEFRLRYLNDIISTNKDKCLNPIIDVIRDKTTGDRNIITL